MKTAKCYIYTRVSTSMQVDGYSLDAQKDKLKRYAEFQDMVIAGEYSDEGKSGKNIDGRPQFLQMLKDIEAMKDKVQYVLVFKLSRFGRNAADVLSSLQRMQDYGVNLICVEDGIDSSKDSGKLMINRWTANSSLTDMVAELGSPAMHAVFPWPRKRRSMPPLQRTHPAARNRSSIFDL